MVSESFAKRFAGRIDVFSKEGNFEGAVKVNRNVFNELLKNSDSADIKEKPSRIKVRATTKQSKQRQEYSRQQNAVESTGVTRDAEDRGGESEGLRKIRSPLINQSGKEIVYGRGADMSRGNDDASVARAAINPRNDDMIGGDTSMKISGVSSCTSRVVIRSPECVAIPTKPPKGLRKVCPTNSGLVPHPGNACSTKGPGYGLKCDLNPRSQVGRSPRADVPEYQTTSVHAALRTRTTYAGHNKESTHAAGPRPLTSGSGSSSNGEKNVVERHACQDRRSEKRNSYAVAKGYARIRQEEPTNEDMVADASPASAVLLEPSLAPAALTYAEEQWQNEEALRHMSYYGRQENDDVHERGERFSSLSSDAEPTALVGASRKKYRAQEEEQKLLLSEFNISPADYVNCAKQRIQGNLPRRAPAPGDILRASSSSSKVLENAIAASNRMQQQRESFVESGGDDSGGGCYSGDDGSQLKKASPEQDTGGSYDDDPYTMDDGEETFYSGGNGTYTRFPVPGRNGRQRVRTLSPRRRDREMAKQRAPKIRSVSVSRTKATMMHTPPSAEPAPVMRMNDRMVKTEKDKLFFSKKPREVDFCPSNLQQYQKKYAGKKDKITSLGPDLESEELLIKKAKQAQIQAFSAHLREINRRRIESHDAPRSKPKEPSKRQRAIEFANSVPKPKVVEHKCVKVENESTYSEVPPQEPDAALTEAMEERCEQWRKHMEHKNQVEYIKSYLGAL